MLKWLRTSMSKAPTASDPSSAQERGSGAGKTTTVQLQIKQDTSGNIALSLIPPESGASPGMDVCIVMDTSGSMGDAANAEGPEEIKLFSKMDLAKRGAEVIARSLSPADTLTILGFQSKVFSWLPRTRMDPQGLEAALLNLGKMRPMGGTALWDGLCAGLQQLEVLPPADKDGAANRLAVVILLTDGQPSPSPPEGEVAALLKYQAAHRAAAEAGRPLLSSKLVTLGFGYDVNSKLLLDLVHTHGPGSDFAFIPDGTMLLTNFVNLMANLKSCCMRRAVLRLLPAPHPQRRARDVAQALEDGFTTGGGAGGGDGAAAAAATDDVPAALRVLGEAAWKPVPAPGGTGLEVQLGDLLYGCPRHVVLQETQRSGLKPDWESWTAELVYEPVGPELSPGAGRLEWPGGAPELDTPFVTQQLQRAAAVSAMHQAVRLAAVDLGGAQQGVKECALATLALQGGPALGGLEPHPVVEDLLGQVSEALSTKEAWSRWGAHYLRSLVCAHRAEACNNFKDPGVLAYGSAHTRSCREQLNSMCDSLPAPTPSIRDRSGAGAAVLGQPVSQAAFTATFNNQRGGCFGPGARVLLADGSLREVQGLRKGDRVAAPGGAATTVLCVVRCSGVAVLRLPGSGLCITPWHPVRLGGAWAFPAQLLARAVADAGADKGARAALCAGVHTPAAVYNLVLDTGHVVLVDGVEAVTLGHGFQEPVVRHPFFGTDAVLRSLQVFPGWQQGRVDLGAAGYELDTATGMVAGFTQAAAGAGALALQLATPGPEAPASCQLVAAP